jgi:membrane protease YdiL (CAAX protease family)
MASTQPIVSDYRKPLTVLAYAVLTLFLTTGLYVYLSLRLDHHLITTGQFSRLRATNEHAVLADSLFYATQLAVALAFFRPLKLVFARVQKGSSLTVDTLKEIGWGFVGGAVALGIAAPALLGKASSQRLGTYLVDHFYTASGVMLFIVLIFLLPILSEGFFRGVLLRLLMETASWPAAVLVTTLIFALLWPTFGFIPGLTLGIVTGILFHRTKSVMPCIVANFVLTIGAIVLLMWHVV